MSGAVAALPEMLGRLKLTAMRERLDGLLVDGGDATYLCHWMQESGLADFSIFPHLDLFPTNTMSDAERWAADLGGPAYVIDEQTAISVVDGVVEVVSEGRWVALGRGCG